MRFQEIATFHPTHLRQFYTKHRDLATQPYADQLCALLDDSCGTLSGRAAALEQLGFVTSQVVANARPLQMQWALENDLNWDETHWLLSITKAQVKAFRPEILFVDDHYTFLAPFLRNLRSECPSIRLVVGWCASAYNHTSAFEVYDVVFSSIPEYVRQFRENGVRAVYLKHAFDRRVLGKIHTTTARTVGFTFIGSVMKIDQYHIQREKLLVELIKKSDLQIWVEVSRPSLKQLSDISLRALAYDFVQGMPKIGVPQTYLRQMPWIRKVTRWNTRPELPPFIDQQIVRHAHKPLFGLEMFEQLHNSKVTLNTHGDNSSLSASNMRLYEATGVGTCLLTDWKSNLSDLFLPDIEVVTYRTTEECIEKARYLLAHEAQRTAIAQAGQKRTLSDHTYDQRARMLVEIITSELQRKPA